MKRLQDRKETTDPVAIKLNIAHTFITHRGWEMVKASITCGRLLTEQKIRLGHGKFMRWTKSELVFSWQTANVYMKLYQFRDMLTDAEPQSLRAALSFIRGDKRITPGLLSGDERVLYRNIVSPIKIVKGRLKKLPIDPIHYESIVKVMNDLQEALIDLLEEIK